MSASISEVSWGVAAAAGLLSFASPCVAPVVPGYLSLVSGVALGSGQKEPRQTERVVIASALFVLGFSAVFVALGATAGAIGSLLEGYRAVLQRVSGLVMIGMGLFVLGFLRTPVLYQDRRVHLIDRPFGPVGAVLIGMAFGLGWTPCIGPVLASILVYASLSETAQDGAILLAMYSLGLGLPFLVASVTLARLVGALAWIRRHFRALNLIGGTAMIGMGLLFVTDRAFYLTLATVSLQRLVGPPLP